MSHLRPMDPDRDVPALTRTLAVSFAGTPEGVLSYLELVGRENMRVLDEGEPTITACLASIPMGHWFGGRVVRTAGIAAVAVAPEARGKKRALALMQEAVREAAQAHTPLLSLYASTQTLYRQVGFEQAGSKFETRVPLRQLSGGTRDLPIESVEAMVNDDPNARLERCYRQYASRFEGCLERSPFIWKRIQESRDQPYQGFAVVPDGPGTDVEGYVFVGQARRDSGRHDVMLSDCAFTTRRAAMRILGFLRDFASMGLTLSFSGGPCHPLVMLLPQQWIEMSFKDYWMIRIGDLERAIEDRGFAPCVNAEVVVHIDDELIAANAGVWRLRVSDGRGHIERCAMQPQFRCDIRTLASIYAGFLSPSQAILIGAAAGHDDAAAALSGAFAGTAPWMVDHF
jgi:predicted acetyltransferase